MKTEIPSNKTIETRLNSLLGETSEPVVTLADVRQCYCLIDNIPPSEIMDYIAGAENREWHIRTFSIAPDGSYSIIFGVGRSIGNKKGQPTRKYSNLHKSIKKPTRGKRRNTKHRVGQPAPSAKRKKKAKKHRNTKPPTDD